MSNIITFDINTIVVRIIPDTSANGYLKCHCEFYTTVFMRLWVVDTIVKYHWILRYDRVATLYDRVRQIS